MKKNKDIGIWPVTKSEKQEVETPQPTFTLEEVESLTYNAMKSVGYTPLCVWQDWAKINLKR